MGLLGIGVANSYGPGPPPELTWVGSGEHQRQKALALGSRVPRATLAHSPRPADLQGAQPPGPGAWTPCEVHRV